MKTKRIDPDGSIKHLKQCAACGATTFAAGSVIHCPICGVGRLMYYNDPVKKRAHKYNAKKSFDREGRAYPSKVERDRGVELQMLEKAGVISDLTYQCGVQILPGIRYKPDFSYATKGQNHRTYEDVKGVTSERFGIICKLWALFGCTENHKSELLVVKRVNGKLQVTKVIKPLSRGELRKVIGL